LVPSTVLIAAAEYLPALLDRIDMGDAAAFSDVDALRALETIVRERPSVIAIERLFAASSRGNALINRIKADPSLSSCEIRVLAYDSQVRPLSRMADPLPPPPPPAPAPAPARGPSLVPVTVLDAHGTRDRERVTVQDDVEVLVDGNPAMLVDVSLRGAQVVSQSVLKPNQRVRMWLHDPTRPIRFTGLVAWATFEIPATGPRYRAGIEFVDASPDMLARFIEANKKQ
jgi:hypothetical protein